MVFITNFYKDKRVFLRKRNKKLRDWKSSEFVLKKIKGFLIQSQQAN